MPRLSNTSQSRKRKVSKDKVWRAKPILPGITKDDVSGPMSAFWQGAKDVVQSNHPNKGEATEALWTDLKEALANEFCRHGLNWRPGDLEVGFFRAARRNEMKQVAC
jgi:hypothetical protein